MKCPWILPPWFQEVKCLCLNDADSTLLSFYTHLSHKEEETKGNPMKFKIQRIMYFETLRLGLCYYDERSPNTNALTFSKHAKNMWAVYLSISGQWIQNSAVRKHNSLPLMYMYVRLKTPSYPN